MKLAEKAYTARGLWDGLDEYERELEWRRCFEVMDLAHCVYFAEKYWTIKIPGRGRSKLLLRPAQIETLKIWLEAKESVTLKARQIGFSTLAGMVSLWLAIGWSDNEVITLSRNGREARKQLKDRVRYGFDDLPKGMRDRVVIDADTIEVLSFKNGSSIQCLPSNNPARGYSAFMIFVDEAAFFEKFDEAWAAIEPAADIGGRIHTLSTANGVGNGFHAMWVRATQTKDSGIVPIFFSWRAAGRDDAWYERQQRKLPGWQLAQEYPSTAEEAFIKSGRPIFDVLSFEGIDITEPAHVGYLVEGITTKNPRFVDQGDGELWIWTMPIMGHKYVIGADVAEGLEHGDYSVAYVIDVSIEPNEVVARWHGHEDPDLFGDSVLWDLACFYGMAFLGVENNNHGIATLLALKRAHYPALYVTHRYDVKGTDQKRQTLGWRTDKNSKRILVDELRSALREAEIVLHDDELGGDFGELRTFVRDVTGKMHGSPHDDRVMALGVANQMRKHWHAFVNVEPEGTYGTYAWLEAQMALADMTGLDAFIGSNAVR